MPIIFSSLHQRWWDSVGWLFQQSHHMDQTKFHVSYVPGLHHCIVWCVGMMRWKKLFHAMHCLALHGQKLNLWDVCVISDQSKKRRKQGNLPSSEHDHCADLSRITLHTSCCADGIAVNGVVIDCAGLLRISWAEILIIPPCLKFPEYRAGRFK